MARFKLTIEYDGGPFAGWQRQADAPSVQAALERAAQAYCGEAVLVQGSGRTDAGVHATGQVAHVDLPDSVDPAKVADALNFHLRPDPVAVLAAEPAPDRFHARFSARRRRYRYVIVNRRADLALERGRAWRIAPPLNAQAMHAAAQALIGRHDFTTFRDAGCQADSPVKTLDLITVSRAADHVELVCEARSFLHRQVRSMVGSLVEVGRARRPPVWIGDILAACERAACGPVAPPDGLYLERVAYEAS